MCIRDRETEKLEKRANKASTFCIHSLDEKQGGEPCRQAIPDKGMEAHTEGHLPCQRLSLIHIFIAIGVVGEYVGKNYMETKARPKFIVETYLHAEEDND